MNSVSPGMRSEPGRLGYGMPYSTRPRVERGDWASREIGSAELVKVAGEEDVDEAAFRRDDALGNLVSKAFDSATAAAMLPPLGLQNVS